MSEDSFSLPSWKAFLVGFGSGLLTTAVGVVAVRQVIQILANRENGDRTDSGSSLNIPRDAVRRHILSSSISTDARLPDNRLASVTGEGSIEGVASVQTGDQHALLAVQSSDERPAALDEELTSQTRVIRQDHQSLLHLLFQIAEDQAQREGFVHRNITCNVCRTSPVCGLRYMCANCIDFDVCERCEPVVNHDKTHVFVQIRRPIPPLASPRSALFKPLYPGKDHPHSKLTWDEINNLKTSTHFDQAEIEGLFEQFHTLSTSGEGLTRSVYDQCLGPLGLEKNLVVDSLFKFYDANGDGVIDFQEFIGGLSIRVKGTWEEKVLHAFQGYDLEKLQSISRDNLRQMFKAYFQITIALVKDVVRACEEEMMANFDDTQERPVSSYFSAPIPAETGTQFVQNGKVPIPGSKGTREDMWPVMETMSQDAIEEMVDNVFKAAKVMSDKRISFDQFKEIAIVDSSLTAWFEALGTVF
ncbi:uncharacterized protein [Apostichopus japonicus]|uniref:uncharacterized protein isoform X2 n=1 Tax=Stichopus japonicus TaxID=307972 RepID=UPI003AB8B507